jgi:hypothetical protein
MMPRIRKINKHYTKEKETHIMVRVMVFNATFNNISVKGICNKDYFIMESVLPRVTASD